MCPQWLPRCLPHCQRLIIVGCLCLCSCVVLGIEPGALCMPGRCYTTELYPNLINVNFILRKCYFGLRFCLHLTIFTSLFQSCVFQYFLNWRTCDMWHGDCYISVLLMSIFMPGECSNSILYIRNNPEFLLLDLSQSCQIELGLSLVANKRNPITLD